MKFNYFLVSMLSLNLVLPNTFAGDDACANQGDDQQATFCTAAKNADKAAKNNTILMGVWGAVGAVCTAACALSTSPTYAMNEWVCMGSSIAGTVADVGLSMMTAKSMQESTGALMSLAGTGVSVMMSSQNMLSSAGREAMKTTGKAFYQAGQTEGMTHAESISHAKDGLNATGTEAGTEAAGKVGKRDMGACIAAVTAIGQSVMKGMSASQARDTKKSALNSAAQLQSQTAAQVTFGNGDIIDSAKEGGGAGGNGTQIVANTTSSNLGGGGCDAAKDTGSIGAIVQCASAFNPELANLISNPKFQEEFKNLSGGQDLGNFIKNINDDTPASSAIGAGLGGLPNSGEILSKLKEIEGQAKILAANEQGSRGGYLSSGRGIASAEEGPGAEAQIGDLLKGMLGQMNGEGEKKEDPLVEEIEFQIQKLRDPATLSENKNISLFARVGYRYKKTMNRLAWGPWSSEHNKALYSNNRNTEKRNPAVVEGDL